MTTHLDAMKAQMRVMMEDAEREGKDWRRRLTLSLTVGNGAGLLNFFGQVKELVTSEGPDRLLMASPWLFLFGLISASIAPYLWAKERGHFSMAMYAGTAVIEPHDEDLGEEEALIKSTLVKEYGKARRALPWLSRIAIVFEILSASAFVIGVSISLIVLGGML